MAGGVVVAVELLPVWALLLAHEDGRPQRVALKELIGRRCELDGHDGTVGPGRRLRSHHV